RLRRAAIGAPLEFSRGVTDLIHQHSEGIPRKINVIADAILLFGYGEERRIIDANLTAEVVDELASAGGPRCRATSNRAGGTGAGRAVAGRHHRAASSRAAPGCGAESRQCDA